MFEINGPAILASATAAGNRKIAGLSERGVENRIQRMGFELARRYDVPTAVGVAAYRELHNVHFIAPYQLRRAAIGQRTLELVAEAIARAS